MVVHARAPAPLRGHTKVGPNLRANRKAKQSLRVVQRSGGGAHIHELDDMATGDAPERLDLRRRGDARALILRVQGRLEGRLELVQRHPVTHDVDDAVHGARVAEHGVHARRKRLHEGRRHLACRRVGAPSRAACHRRAADTGCA